MGQTWTQAGADHAWTGNVRDVTRHAGPGEEHGDAEGGCLQPFSLLLNVYCARYSTAG